MKGLILGRSIIAAACLGVLPAAFAGTPLWTFKPLTDTAFSLTSTETATVQYTVYNQSEKAKRLVLDSALTPGVQQANTCFLQPQSQKGSCLLTLNINGSALPASGIINAGPVLCQANADGSPNHNQCYQPDGSYRLNIQKTNVSQLVPISVTSDIPLRLRTRGPVGSLTITNRSTTMTARNIAALFIGTPLENNVTSSSCTSIAPRGTCTINFTPSVTPVATSTFAIQGTNTTAVNALLSIRASFLYVASTLDNSIYRCQINDDASLGNCGDSGVDAVFDHPQGIAIDNNGTFAYVTQENNNIARCAITSEGKFDAGTCTNTLGSPVAFNVPIGIALTSDNRAVYVANRDLTTSGESFISRCLINDTGAVETCTNAGAATGTYQPNGIVLTTNDTRVYITAPFAGDLNEVRLCSRNATGDLVNCQNASIGANPFNGAHGIAFNRSGTIGYITNTAGYISQCTVNSSGLFETCDHLGTISFTNPTGIAINVEGDQVYISEYGDSTISNCSVIGGSPTCTGTVTIGNGLQYLVLR